jgi:hypothetical protein
MESSNLFTDLFYQELGGLITLKVPRAGFVLLDPGSAEATRLQECWRSEERLDRHFVPYTFVDACQASKAVIPQIFLKGSKPVCFHIHSSISRSALRETISQRIAVSYDSFCKRITLKSNSTLVGILRHPRKMRILL